MRAVDLEDNVSEPASVDFELTGDTVAPLAAITIGPATQSIAVDVTFTFTVDDPNALVECSLDGMAFEACESPHQVQGLLPGAHELQVRATDLNGNVSPRRRLPPCRPGAPLAGGGPSPEDVERRGHTTW